MKKIIKWALSKSKFYWVLVFFNSIVFTIVLRYDSWQSIITAFLCGFIISYIADFFN